MKYFSNRLAVNQEVKGNLLLLLHSKAYLHTREDHWVSSPRILWRDQFQKSNRSTIDSNSYARVTPIHYNSRCLFSITGSSLLILQLLLKSRKSSLISSLQSFDERITFVYNFYPFCLRVSIASQPSISARTGFFFPTPVCGATRINENNKYHRRIFLQHVLKGSDPLIHFPFVSLIPFLRATPCSVCQMVIVSRAQNAPVSLCTESTVMVTSLNSRRVLFYEGI